MYTAQSTLFYPGHTETSGQELSDEVIVPAMYLNRVLPTFNENETLYVTITNVDTNISYMVTIGSSHNYDKTIIYVPQWILDIIGCEADRHNIIRIRKATNPNNIPVATKITIKPLDPVAFEIDTLACFEHTLMNLHSIKENITIPVHTQDGYEMFAYIAAVEPAELSRIVHGEVNVEFINEFETRATSVTAATSVAPNIVSDTAVFSSNFGNNAPPISTPVTAAIVTTVQEQEERRRQVRESWLKRFQNNGEKQ